MDSIHLEDIVDMKIQTDDRCLEIDQWMVMLLTLPDKNLSVSKPSELFTAGIVIMHRYLHNYAASWNPSF